MAQSRLHVELLRYTPRPEEVVAMGAKLCYSPADINDLKQGIESKDQAGFVDKLVAMGHMSPVEHVSFTFGVEGISRACSHQIVRHRVASYSQQSQRYVGEQTDKHQGKVFDYVIPPTVADAGKAPWFEEKMQIIQGWYDELNAALGNRGEKSQEDARFILPNAAETKIIITMNARELLHFFRVRCCNRAQWEIRAMADEMLRKVKAVAPMLFKEAGPGCLKGKCPEGKMTCGKTEEVREKFRNM
ncbi:MAG: FAD-dependent thymidylate synthase [bacterium]